MNPARPDISVLYNPFHCSDDDYMPVVNMVFGSFNLHDEFFAKHQLNYLADIVRVLVYTGLKFNFYDVLVMAIDDQVLRDQVEKATRRIERDPAITTQRRLNFEMSVKNLYQSFQDRERVPKIQGLLNECMTFLDDELSGGHSEIDRRLADALRLALRPGSGMPRGCQACSGANSREITPRSTSTGTVASPRPIAAMLDGALGSVLSRIRPLTGLLSWR